MDASDHYAYVVQEEPGLAAAGLDNQPHTWRMNEGDALAAALVRIEDSADVRLFIELSGHSSDLLEAHNVFQLAIQVAESDSELPDPGLAMVAYGALAYCRTILHSKVRAPITDYIEIPAELSEINDAIRMYRHRTVAHSQSDLAVTHPVGWPDPKTGKVVYVGAVTILLPVPVATIREFLHLVDAVSDALDQVIDPVRDRIQATLGAVDPATMQPFLQSDLIHKVANEFDPTTKRSGYPSSQTFYWTRETTDLEVGPSDG